MGLNRKIRYGLIGEENALKIRLYGDEASLEWSQENPNYLRLKYFNKPEELYKMGRYGL